MRRTDDALQGCVSHLVGGRERVRKRAKDTKTTDFPYPFSEKKKVFKSARAKRAEQRSSMHLFCFLPLSPSLSFGQVFNGRYYRRLPRSALYLPKKNCCPAIVSGEILPSHTGRWVGGYFWALPLPAKKRWKNVLYCFVEMKSP